MWYKCGIFYYLLLLHYDWMYITSNGKQVQISLGYYPALYRAEIKGFWSQHIYKQELSFLYPANILKENYHMIKYYYDASFIKHFSLEYK